MDNTPWSLILNVVKKENMREAHQMSDEESLALGKELLTRWHSGKLNKDKEEILTLLYRYYLSQGGAKLPEDLNSVKNMMALKEFTADTLRDAEST